jgi:hypothetical protein
LLIPPKAGRRFQFVGRLEAYLDPIKLDMPSRFAGPLSVMGGLETTANYVTSEFGLKSVILTVSSAAWSGL